jgi:hypothetical protein
MTARWQQLITLQHIGRLLPGSYMKMGVGGLTFVCGVLRMEA